MHVHAPRPRGRIRPLRRVRRGLRRAFNLVELLMALAISSALLTAVFLALDASFDAYQRTTETTSTQTVGRLVVQRVQTLVRSGVEFGPVPANPNQRIVESNLIDIRLVEGGPVITIEWHPLDEELVYYVDGGTEYVLLEGVIEQLDPDTGDPIPPFRLEFEQGRELYRATMDLAIMPDDSMDVELEGDDANNIVLRLVASAMPRQVAYQPED